MYTLTDEEIKNGYTQVGDDVYFEGKYQYSFHKAYDPNKSRREQEARKRDILDREIFNQLVEDLSLALKEKESTETIRTAWKTFSESVSQLQISDPEMVQSFVTV